MTQLVQSLSSGFALGALYAVIGIGFVVIHRVTGVVNLTQGALAVLGAYMMATLVTELPWALAMLVSAAVTAAVAALIACAVLTAGTRHEYAPVIMTLGLAIASEGMFVLVWGDIPRTYPAVSDTAFRLAGAFVLPQQLLLVAAVAVLLVLLQAFFTMSFLGKALTAAALNRKAAQLVGVDLLRMGVTAFAVSGFIVGLSGSIFGALVPVTPHSHLGLAISGFAAAVLGNFYSPAVTVVGGLALGQLTSATATYGLPEYQQVVALAVLVAVLLARTTWMRRGGVLA